ncbi:MAG: DUF1963 domain-containing protein [Coriobacteriaceae bacterium]|jgi:uncharacterized protein YwqG|nr:DUF1963 domain-containing protein [Coriobacteriaceae bacterium]
MNRRSEIKSTLQFAALVAFFLLCIEKVLSFFILHLDIETELIVYGVVILVVFAGAGILLLFPAVPVPASAQDMRELTDDELAEVKALLAQTNRPSIKLTLHDRPTTPYDSKLGGTPYLPPGFKYPYNKNDYSEKMPLKLLCQLNFAQLPPLKGFPTEGILQFYLSGEEVEDTYALDYEEPTKQKGWRVVYHEKLIDDATLLQAPPVLDEAATENFPLKGEFYIHGELQVTPINDTDKDWLDFWENVFEPSPIGEQLKDLYAEDEILFSLINAMDYKMGHRMGGYPCFTQNDPREDTCKGHSVLLLQLDSEEQGENGIMWGDAGVANFFITPKALENKDFSRVLYNWDCA